MRITGIQNFELEELVDRPIFEQYGARSIMFLDRALVSCVDRLHDKVGALVVNNWHAGGTFHESGLRLFNTPTGAAMSQHKFGSALDLKPVHMTPAELFAYIQSHRADYPEITTVEDVSITKTWLHVDGRWHDSGDLLIVRP